MTDLVSKQLLDFAPDYTKVEDGKTLLNALNDDALGWSIAFVQNVKKKFDFDIPVLYAQLWFTNAIEHSYEFRKTKEQEEIKISKDDIIKQEEIIQSVKAKMTAHYTQREDLLEKLKAAGNKITVES